MGDQEKMQKLFEQITALLHKTKIETQIEEGDVITTLSNVAAYIIAQAPESAHRQIMDHAIMVLEAATPNFVIFLQQQANPQ